MGGKSSAGSGGRSAARTGPVSNGLSPQGGRTVPGMFVTPVRALGARRFIADNDLIRGDRIKVADDGFAGSGEQTFLRAAVASDFQANDLARDRDLPAKSVLIADGEGRPYMPILTSRIVATPQKEYKVRL